MNVCSANSPNPKRTPFRRHPTDDRWVKPAPRQTGHGASFWRMTMVREIALGLVAAATISAAALAPTAASAKPFGMGGGFGGGFGGGWHHHHIGGLGLGIG